MLDSKEIVMRVQQVLEDKKGEDIVVIDVGKDSSIADFIVIASGSVGRKVIAMADAVCDELRVCSKDKPKVEGKEEGDWVVVDGGDVIVHLQKSIVREYYRLEDIWLKERKEHLS